MSNMTEINREQFGIISNIKKPYAMNFKASEISRFHMEFISLPMSRV